MYAYLNTETVYSSTRTQTKDYYISECQVWIYLAAYTCHGVMTKKFRYFDFDNLYMNTVPIIFVVCLRFIALISGEH